MKTFYFFFCIIPAMVFISCEGPKTFSITVVDKVSKKPIDSVLVSVRPKAGSTDKTVYNLDGYTDSTGKFARTEMIGYGLSPTKWDFYMEYNKPGYIHKTEVNKTEGVVEMERVK